MGRLETVGFVIVSFYVWYYLKNFILGIFASDEVDESAF